MEGSNSRRLEYGRAVYPYIGIEARTVVQLFYQEATPDGTKGAHEARTLV